MRFFAGGGDGNHVAFSRFATLQEDDNVALRQNVHHNKLALIDACSMYLDICTVHVVDIVEWVEHMLRFALRSAKNHSCGLHNCMLSTLHEFCLCSIPVRTYTYYIVLSPYHDTHGLERKCRLFSGYYEENLT